MRTAALHLARPSRFLVLAALLLGVVSAVLGPRRAAAQDCFADCNANGMLQASDIGRINATLLRCNPCADNSAGGVAAGCEAFAGGCTAADFNGDGCLKASELGRANSNILKIPDSHCGPLATPTGGGASTSTPSPTQTPVPPTSTATQIVNTPTQTRTPTPEGVCGDGLLSGAETCQSCAQDCTVSPCTVASPAPTITFRVNWAAPPGQPVSGVRVRLAYRSALVSLPGTGTAPAARFKNRPSNSNINVNDLNYATDVLISKSGSLPEGRLFTTDFDRCSSAAAPVVSDFLCTVLECASSFGMVSGCTCTVVTP